MSRIEPRLRAWLRDWAAWHEASQDYATGYASSTPEWRAMMAQRITEFTSCLPKGVEPPRGLARLCLALATVKEDPDAARFVTVTQRFYVIQHYHGEGTEAAELCAKEYRKARQTIYEWKLKGERAVDNWLRCN